MPLAQKFDCAIIGGGIVGLATAWALLQRNPSSRVVVVEKEKDWARHQTGRNSGVIHSGIYYKPGSLKAKLCREGNQRVLDFCRENGIPFEICGKVIVATSEGERPALQKIFDRGVANGLDVRKLSPGGVAEIEPHVKCVEGVLVPSTGIVSYTAICRKLAELIQNRGGVLRPGTRVTGFARDQGGIVVETDRDVIATRVIVNCAGLHSDRIVRLAGAQPTAQIVPFRGEYYEIRPERRSLVKNLIYPVPDPQFPFLGVHFTRMIDGSIHAGPNAVLSMKREGYHRTSFNLRDFAETMTYGGFWKLASKHAAAGLREMHRSFSKAAFVRSLQQLIPEITAEDLVPGEAGVRAQALLPDGGLVDDFLIIREANAVHVCNAPSPAATASLEIGRYVAEQVPARN
ncbi:MAG TPA: L-2-hydroxyglutarate oxidase [Candidatus Didemnitutus sp.]|nr:L-2-hydroxyglutarate oxidase [Candidatus Didemnitutus sp.]